MKSKLPLMIGCLAAVGTAWAQDDFAAVVPAHLNAQSAAEFVSGTAPASGSALRLGDARWIVRSSKSVQALEQHTRRAFEEAAAKRGVKLAPAGDGAFVASTTWQSIYRQDRAMVPELSDAERAEKCVEKGPDVSRVVGGVVGLALGMGHSQAASMIGSGARAGNEALQWQRYDHLAAADRVACGRGEYVLETKVVVSASGGGQVLEFAVRSALPGGAMPAEAATLVGRNAEAVVLELEALQSGTCDRAIKCGNAVSVARRSTAP
jgi:hypothetical protein